MSQIVGNDETLSGTDLIEDMSKTVAIKTLDFEPRWILAFGSRNAAQGCHCQGGLVAMGLPRRWFLHTDRGACLLVGQSD